VPGPRAFRHNLLIDAFSIVANPQAKLPIVVSDFRFNAARLRVTEGISEHFKPDSENLVLKNR